MNGIKPLAGLLLAFGATSVSAQGDNTDGFYVGMGLDSSGEDAVYSVGLGFTFLKRLSLKLEYEEIEIEDFDEADAAWLTASWRF